MRNKSIAPILLTIFMYLPAQAQNVPSTAGNGMSPGPKKTIIYRREMGKWWQDSDVAKKLQLSDAQISQLDQVFYQHRLKLIDYTADMEKEDLKLQNLLDADTPDEGQVNSQVDEVLAARGKVEKEFTSMNLDTRKVLSLQQWRQLKSVRGDLGMPGNKVFFRRVLPGGQPAPDELPPLPPPPPDIF